MRGDSAKTSARNAGGAAVVAEETFEGGELDTSRRKSVFMLRDPL